MEEGHEFSLQSTLLSAIFWSGQIGLKFLAFETPRGWCQWPVCYHYYGVHFSLGSHTSDKNGIEGHLGQDICGIPLEGQVSKLCNAAGAAESKCKTRQDSVGICSSDSEDPQVSRKWHVFWFWEAVCSGGPNKSLRIPCICEQMSRAGGMASNRPPVRPGKNVRDEQCYCRSYLSNVL